MNFTWNRHDEETAVEFCRSPMDIQKHLDTRSAFSVVDGEVARLWDTRSMLHPKRERIFILDAREEHKSPGTLAAIWEKMSKAGAGRKTTVLGIGGGLTLDVAALAASTWHRGTGLVIANNDWQVSPDGKRIALLASTGSELDGIWLLDID